MIGKLVLINRMEGEPQYHGRIGIVNHIDDAGQIHGSWGGCALCKNSDDFRIIENKGEIRFLLLHKFFRTIESNNFYIYKGNHFEMLQIIFENLNDEFLIIHNENDGIIALLGKEFKNIEFNLFEGTDNMLLSVDIRSTPFKWTIRPSIDQILESKNKNQYIYENFCFFLKSEIIDIEDTLNKIKKIYEKLPEEDQLITEVMYNEI